MAEQSKTHLWINTAIACVAALVSSGSAVVTWRSFSLNVESLGLTSSFTYDCLFSFGATIKDGKQLWQAGLCWKVTIANQSNSRISIISYRATSDGPTVAEFIDDKGRSIPTPITLDAGEARTFLIRASVSGTPLLKKTIDESVKEPNDKPYLGHPEH
jgi:hypothetical protein